MFNTLGATKQQFAAFQQGDYTILGVEDIFSNTLTPSWQPGTADYDYNDVMFGFRAAAVPEPGTLLLLGMGLAGVAVQRRRKTGQPSRPAATDNAGGHRATPASRPRPPAASRSTTRSTAGASLSGARWRTRTGSSRAVAVRPVSRASSSASSSQLVTPLLTQ